MTTEALITEVKQLQRRIELLETNEALPIVAMYTTVSDSIGSGSAQVVDFNTQVYDTWNAVTTGASWVFTAPIGGYYLVRSQVVFNSSSAWAVGEFGWMQVRKNTTNYAYVDYWNHKAGTIYTKLAGGVVVEVAKDDTLDVYIFQGSGATLTLRSTPVFNYVCVARLG